MDFERLEAARLSESSFNDSKSLFPAGNALHLALPEQVPGAPGLEYAFNPARPFLPSPSRRRERCEEIISIQTAGLAKRMEHTRAQRLVIGISGGLVVGTGDLSEIALGWSTYNGDHMSMYAVNCSIPKTLIRCLIEHIAEESSPELAATLTDINNTPVSPELLPPSDDGTIEQKTEDVLGPYDLHDFFLFHFIKYGAEPDKILHLAEHAFRGEFQPDFIRRCLDIFIRRFFRQQFKRSCMPDGPKVGTISLSPRGDWRMPSDACGTVWEKAISHY